MTILHDHQQQCFFTVLNGESFRISYSKPDPGTMKIESTYSPRGVTDNDTRNALAEHVLNYAKENRLQVVVVCMFVRDFIDENPQYYALEIRKTVAS